jgi:predicted nucleic acid-binding protein
MQIRVLVDTNVFIVGFLGLSQQEENVESQVLRQLADQQRFTVLFSNELSDQIRRVARRVGGKDWAGLLLNLIWQTFNIEIVPIPELIEVFEEYKGKIPSEDILIFVTATLGQADCLISRNHEFIRQAMAEQDALDCLAPAEFLAKYSTRESESD